MLGRRVKSMQAVTADRVWLFVAWPSGPCLETGHGRPDMGETPMLREVVLNDVSHRLICTTVALMDGSVQRRVLDARAGCDRRACAGRSHHGLDEALGCDS